MILNKHGDGGGGECVRACEVRRVSKGGSGTNYKEL